MKYFFSIFLISAFSLSMAQTPLLQVTVHDVPTHLVDIEEDNISHLWIVFSDQEKHHVQCQRFDGLNWNSEAALPEEAQASTALDLYIHDNTPYVICATDKLVRVFKYDNKAWVSLGAQVQNPQGNPGIHSVDFTYANGTPYILVGYENAEQSCRLYSFDKTWKRVKLDGFPENAQEGHLCSNDDGEVFISWYNAAKGRVDMMKSDPKNGHFETIGKGLPKKINANMDLVNVDGVIYSVQEQKGDSAWLVLKWNFSTNEWESYDTTLPLSDSPKKPECFSFNQDRSFTYINQEGKPTARQETEGGWGFEKYFGEKASTMATCYSAFAVHVIYVDNNNGHKALIRKIEL